MRRKLLATAILTSVASLSINGAGAAQATEPSGLQSEPLARGAAGQFTIKDKSGKFSVKAGAPTDVAIVRATITPGGFTGWHGHPGPSMVVVKSGTLTLQSEHQGQCMNTNYGPGKSFVHEEDAHNFVNEGSEPLEFYVAYFVPEGANPLLIDAPAPAGCP
jgi:quercetin dioxygenase-like cupin family protein